MLVLSTTQIIILFLKYAAATLFFAMFIKYQSNPIWNNWTWRGLMALSVVNILFILYNRWKMGMDATILIDAFWVLFYVAIIYLYALEFSSKDDIKKRNDKLPFNVGGKIKVISWIGFVLSCILVVCSILAFIPITRIFALPILNVLSNIF